MDEKKVDNETIRHLFLVFRSLPFQGWPNTDKNKSQGRDQIIKH